MAAGTLPSVGTARSVGRRTQHFLFIYYGNTAICALRASVGSTDRRTYEACSRLDVILDVCHHRLVNGYARY
jgi:hypothetical protein